MNHSYIIFANHKERIMKLVELIHGINGYGTAKFEDMVQITTEDDDLAAILDKVLREAKPEASAVLKKTKGKKQPLEKRICSECHTEFVPRMPNQRLCSSCSRKKYPASYKNNPGFSTSKTKVWTLCDSGENVTHAELEQRLKEHTIPVYARLDHKNNGAYRVIEHGSQLRIEKVLE